LLAQAEKLQQNNTETSVEAHPANATIESQSIPNSGSVQTQTGQTSRVPV